MVSVQLPGNQRHPMNISLKALSSASGSVSGFTEIYSFRFGSLMPCVVAQQCPGSSWKYSNSSARAWLGFGSNRASRRRNCSGAVCPAKRYLEKVNTLSHSPQCAAGEKTRSQKRILGFRFCSAWRGHDGE